MKYFLLLISFLLLVGTYPLDDTSLYAYTFVDEKVIDNSIDFVNVNADADTMHVVEKSPSDVLETQVGKLSGYGPDCYGCSGYLAYGDYVGDGRVYYQDREYGNVRIVAGDRKYPFGTIIRIHINGKEPFLAIVLDRGGAIGFGKKALFDLLYPNEYLANLDGVFYNTQFEVLRYGF